MYIKRRTTIIIQDYYYPDEIAEKLYSLSADAENDISKDTKEQMMNELTEALCHLKATAENQYNGDYFRTLWNCLQSITSIE